MGYFSWLGPVQPSELPDQAKRAQLVVGMFGRDCKISVNKISRTSRQNHAMLSVTECFDHSRVCKHGPNQPLDDTGTTFLSPDYMNSCERRHSNFHDFFSTVALSKKR